MKLDTLPDVTFVVNKSGDPSVYRNNFAASPALQLLPAGRVIVQEGFSSASLGYNDAIEKAATDLIVFSHQDVYPTKQTLYDLDEALNQLRQSEPNWGVLECLGNRNRRVETGHLYSAGLGIFGKQFESPTQVEPLEEYALILRKSTKIPRFPIFISTARIFVCPHGTEAQELMRSPLTPFTTGVTGLSLLSVCDVTDRSAKSG